MAEGGDPTYRETFYERYVTVSGLSEREGRARGRYFDWCRRKYLPLLAGCDRRAPVLELGCGQGALLEFLMSAGFESVNGVDLSAEQVDRARRRGLPASVGDAFDALDGRRNEYGLIVALDFIEHLSKEEIVRLLGLIREALLPDGLLLLQTPNGEGLMAGQVIHGDFTHTTILTPGSLSQVLRLSGFTRIEMRETGPAPVGLSGIVRTIAWQALRLGATAVRWIETGKTQWLWTENVICAASTVDQGDRQE